jgi:hypothetical protein
MAPGTDSWNSSDKSGRELKPPQFDNRALESADGGQFLVLEQGPICEIPRIRRRHCLGQAIFPLIPALPSTCRMAS